MLFNSHIFLFVFLPVCAAVFFLLGRKQRYEAAMGWLVLASLFFYGWWNPVYLALIGVSIVVNFQLGRAISRHEGRHVGRFLLLLGVCFNLGLLFYFKYMNFIVDSVNYLAGTDFFLERIVLPLAISFFTFQQIAYLVDARLGQTREYNFLHYCLFVTFFPQLIAGPIVHHKEMLSQFQKRDTFRLLPENITVGLTIFVIGLFKKVVLADSIAPYAVDIFGAADQGRQILFLDAWAGLLAYFFQLYFDFSGYSDMAIGLARLFGIRLPMNFNSPYKATNLSDMWARWHITLTRFLTQYVYITGGGSQRGYPRYLFNLWLTMFLAGLWHGAGANFVVFGLIQGSCMAIHGAWKTFKEKLPLDAVPAWLGTAVAWGLTMSCWWLSMIIFRATTLEGGWNMMQAFIGLNGLGLDRMGELMADEDIVPLLVLMGAIVWLLPNTQQVMHRFNPVIEKVRWQPRWRWQALLEWQPTLARGVVVGAMALTALLMLDRISEFLYFQF